MFLPGLSAAGLTRCWRSPLVLLAAVLLSPLGVTAGGSSRWLRLGPLRFQPSEFARFALIVYLAYSLEKKADRIKDFSIGFMPHVVVLGVVAVLILKQPDFGSAVILAALTWLMMFVGGVRLLYLGSSCVLLGLAGLYFISLAGYRVATAAQLSGSVAVQFPTPAIRSFTP